MTKKCKHLMTVIDINTQRSILSFPKLSTYLAIMKLHVFVASQALKSTYKKQKMTLNCRSMNPIIMDIRVKLHNINMWCNKNIYYKHKVKRIQLCNIVLYTRSIKSINKNEFNDNNDNVKQLNIKGLFLSLIYLFIIISYPILTIGLNKTRYSV